MHGLEMKNDLTVIKDTHFYNMACVFVEEGTPASIYQNRLTIFEAIPSVKGIDNCYYEFASIFINYYCRRVYWPYNDKLHGWRF